MNQNKDYLIENISTIHAGAIPRTSTGVSEHLPSNYRDVIEDINSGKRVCIILRGLPGSGKSFLARKIIEDTIRGNGEGHIISADNYFMRGGRYMWDASKLSEAHTSAQRMFFNHASKGYSPLVVDNTNMKYWEMSAYLQGSVQYGYVIHIIEPITPWRWNSRVLAEKNKHGVPFEKIKQMKENYETGLSVMDMLHGFSLQPVKEPKMRQIPPFNLIDLPDENLATEIEPKTDQNANWNPFVTATTWEQPPQIFEDKWDQPNDKEVTTKNKEEKVQEPQPQRKPKKDKKEDLQPHRNGCPNENEKFTQLRELYPDITDSFIWDLFVKCEGDSNWVAEILIDDDKSANHKKGTKLNCDCGQGPQKSSSSSSSDAPSSPQTKKFLLSDNSGRKNTPVKTKKTKNADASAIKAQIEANVKIDDKFYPDHVRNVKKWKNPLLPTPDTVTTENGQPPPSSNEIVELSIAKKLIFELDEHFGDGLLKFSERELPARFFINEDTARQLYGQIMEVFKSQEVESQLEAVKNDAAFAQQLADIERSEKYPKLFTQTNGNLKEIMENEEAMKNYHEEMNGYGSKDGETLAIMIKKQRLYKAFPGTSQAEINTLFEVMQFDFNETVKMLQESNGMSAEQCKKVKEQLDNDKFWRSDSSSEAEEEEEDEIDPTPENDNIRIINELQEQIEFHQNEKTHCYRIANEKKQARDFATSNYYRQMAELHKKQAEEKSLERGSALANIHASNQRNPTSIDLHFHNVIEAETVLQTFIDKNIARLRDIQKPFEELSIITGKGKNSKGGIPAIKNMTVQLLKNRQLRSTSDDYNPGLLKVKIFYNSKLSTELAK